MIPLSLDGSWTRRGVTMKTSFTNQLTANY